MSKPWQIERRTLLRGAGAAMALPLLDAMGPSIAQAAKRGSAPPVRMAFLFVPNGVNMETWKPKTTGKYAFTPTLKPLEPFKRELLVLSELTHDKARANGDGAGDHARSGGTFLTGKQCLKNGGIRVGVSVDQVAAGKIGDATYLPSIELGIDPGRTAGNCDSGYSCAYSSNISWRSESTPMAKEINPKQLFERMFRGRKPRIPRWGAQQQAAAKTTQQSENPDSLKKSVIDLVMSDAKSLRGNLGVNDQRKLDEYLDSIRSLERRIEFAARDRHTHHEETAPAKGKYSRLPKIEVPEGRGIPSTLEDHMKLMCDLMVVAFQTDTTRIATFMLANEGSNRSYPDLGVKDGHHSISHHQGDKGKLDHIAKIDEFNVRTYAHLLQRMSETHEGTSTLLDNSMVLYGSGIGDGNRHNHDDLPILLAGRAGGSITPGRHVKYKPNTPLCNLFLEMLARVGAPTQQFGDSTGRLPGLKA